jgi:transposase-like protein
MSPMAESRSRRPRRRFDKDFKAQAVRLVLNEGQSVTAVARDLDLTRTALHAWVEQARVDQGQGGSPLLSAPLATFEPVRSAGLCTVGSSTSRTGGSRGGANRQRSAA